MVKKRKKKTYTTPKKIKHVYQNKPLNILQSIYNPRCKECNNNMSIHLDRLTCSTCGICILKKKNKKK